MNEPNEPACLKNVCNWPCILRFYRLKIIESVYFEQNQ